MLKFKKIHYDPKIDAYEFVIESGPEYEHREIEPGIYFEYNKKGALIGIEVLDATKNLPKLFKEKTALEKFAFA